MNEIQANLLNLINEKALSGMSLRDIGSLINEVSAQKIKHHLLQLQKKGFIEYSPQKKIIKRNSLTESELIPVPIVGSANCGPANIIATENINAYMKVSKNILPKTGTFFFIEAEGDSMNNARVNNKFTIEPGDYVLVDSLQKHPTNGDYVVSVIDGCANIKKFKHDKINKRIVLESESTKKFFPILIHENDDFVISGKVIDVIKQS